jgi:N-acetylglutamate synthase-like GNAT family acetyltransferase
MDIVIREARIDEADRIVEMGRKFFLSGPYSKQLEDNPESFLAFTRGLIQNPAAKVLVAEDAQGLVIGVLAMIVSTHYLSGEMVGVELIWYVEPEYRGQASLELFWAAEKEAKKMGAVRMQFTAPNEKVGEIYKRLHYTQLEVGYQRSL